jgi:methylphosphotriester-DNA--protein-cysteine methyltransferase
VFLILAVSLAFVANALELQKDAYHGNTDSKIFHQSSCRYFNYKNCTRVFDTREEAIKAGYRPCKVCNP